MRKKKRPRLKTASIATLGIVLAGLCLLGWNWLNGLVCHEIDVSGNRHADREEILALAHVDSGAYLFRIDPGLIANRVRHHPWVREAHVTRMPPGTLSIRVEERQPVLLALGNDGRPVLYLDADGFPMSVVDGAVYDVPLLRRAPLPQQIVDPLEDRTLLELAAALGTVDETIDAILSSFEVEHSGGVTLRTVPSDGRGSLAVRLGRDGFPEKFKRLRAFWDQAVLTRPEKQFEVIDLRFDSQIVTREEGGT